MSGNNFVERFCHKHFQKNPKKSKDEILKQLTHLYLNGRKLDEIVSIGFSRLCEHHRLIVDLFFLFWFQGELPCDQLKVLYLHNNSIQKITNLDHMCHLTHLYLQWNRIRKIENLSALKNLKKLYLSYNEIQRLECVENLHQLEELHLEYQSLPSSQRAFTFDENSMIGVSVSMQYSIRIAQSTSIIFHICFFVLAHVGKSSLRSINISGLNLQDLEAIKTLPNLVELIAADNQFEDSCGLATSISQLRRLKLATFANCPAHKNDIYYRNKIILASKTLGMCR